MFKRSGGLGPQCRSTSLPNWVGAGGMGDRVYGTGDGIKFPKKEILMADISRSCDPFLGGSNFLFWKFNGLHNQVM